ANPVAPTIFERTPSASTSKGFLFEIAEGLHFQPIQLLGLMAGAEQATGAGSAWKCTCSVAIPLQLLYPLLASSPWTPLIRRLGLSPGASSPRPQTPGVTRR